MDRPVPEDPREYVGIPRVRGSILSRCHDREDALCGCRDEPRSRTWSNPLVVPDVFSSARRVQRSRRLRKLPATSPGRAEARRKEMPGSDRSPGELACAELEERNSSARDGRSRGGEEEARQEDSFFPFFYFLFTGVGGLVVGCGNSG